MNYIEDFIYTKTKFRIAIFLFKLPKKPNPFFGGWVDTLYYGFLFF